LQEKTSRNNLTLYSVLDNADTAGKSVAATIQEKRRHTVSCSTTWNDPASKYPATEGRCGYSSFFPDTALV
jgi:hypothetical protein